MSRGSDSSIWLSTIGEDNYPTLDGDVRTEVAIIGGGIAGISAAYFLKRAGKKVAVIDSGRILHGVTGNTTAKLTSLHTLIYDHLISSFGKEKARQYADANQSAITEVSEVIAKERIDCDFEWMPSYTYAEDGQSLSQVKREVEAAKELGLPASFISQVPLPVLALGAIKFENQAQFHPLKYLQALARLIPGEGSFIVENTRATGMKEGDLVEITTDKGTVFSDHAVIATHFPFYDKPGMYYARMYPDRSYALAIETKEDFPKGTFIGASQPGYSFRTQPYGDRRLVIFGGESHKTGQGRPGSFKRLEDAARSIFGVKDILFRWGTQDNVTVDRVPYIGRLTSGHKRIYVSTGFGGWGMSTGTVSGIILKDMIMGKANPWADVFDPTRFTPITSAKEFVVQNVNVAAKFVEGKATTSGKDKEDLKQGEGAVVVHNGKKAAAFRSPDGKLIMLDPSCTHMGCTVSWNGDERSWDCPCHGSRFSAEGEVLHGPAMKGLPRLDGDAASKEGTEDGA